MDDFFLKTKAKFIFKYKKLILFTMQLIMAEYFI